MGGRQAAGLGGMIRDQTQEAGMETQSVQPEPRARWKVVTITIVAVLLMILIAGTLVVVGTRQMVNNQFDQIEQELDE